MCAPPGSIYVQAVRKSEQLVYRCVVPHDLLRYRYGLMWKHFGLLRYRYGLTVRSGQWGFHNQLIINQLQASELGIML